MPETSEKPYQVFDGNSYTALMLQLREPGFIPASMAYVIRERADIKNKYRPIFLPFFDTGDGAGYDGKGNAAVVLDAQDLWNSKPDNKLKRRALALTSGRWEELRSGDKVLYIPKKEVEQIHGKGYAKDKVSGKYVPANEPVEKFWNFIARGEVDVDDYARIIGEESRSDNIMNVIFDRKRYKTPVMLAWTVDSIGSRGRSDAFGNYGLNLGARLLALNANSESATKTESLDEIVAKA